MRNAKQLLVALMLSLSLSILSGCVLPEPVRIVISPPDLPIKCAEAVVFRAIGYDEYEKITPIREAVIWSVSPDSGVEITPSSISKDVTITFPSEGNYLVRAATGYLNDEIEVAVLLPELKKIEVQPLASSLIVGESQEFIVRGYDQFNDLMPISDSVSWSVTGGVGTADPVTGQATTFTAEMVGDGTIRAEAGLLSDTSSISVSEAPASVLTYIVISPQFATIVNENCAFLTATPYDQYDNVMAPTSTPTWSVTGGLGTITPDSGWAVYFCAVFEGLGEISVTCESITESFAIEVLPCT